ncbi:hypothetical protein SAMN05661080_04038 [Modestobacter sp. DSM 44400]|nr:hypothetical protein [Modestobacter sp. DSM 44400]SDY61404.1 hypothetical protein SAMN05661080_04038 [Modestobacter sp. DSM 44400]
MSTLLVGLDHTEVARSFEATGTTSPRSTGGADDQQEDPRTDTEESP